MTVVRFVENIYIELSDVLFDPEMPPCVSDLEVCERVLDLMHTATSSQTSAKVIFRAFPVGKICTEHTHEIRLVATETDLVTALLEENEPRTDIDSPDFCLRLMLPPVWCKRLEKADFHLLLVAKAVEFGPESLRVLYSGPLKIRSDSNAANDEVFLSTHPVLSMEEGECWHIFALVLPEELTSDSYLGVILERLDIIAADDCPLPVFPDEVDWHEITEEVLPEYHPFTCFADVMLSAADPVIAHDHSLTHEPVLYGWELSSAVRSHGYRT